MANKQPPRCTCGGTFGSDGVCPACGRKRPRSAGYRIWHSFWCVIAVLILLACISITCAVRSHLRSGKLTAGLRESRLSDASLPFTDTPAAYIRREFVNDELVLESDVAEAVDALELPAFLAGKLSDYGRLLRGDSDTVVTVETDEITALLDSKRAALYQQCMLVIEDADLQQLHDSLDGPLSALSSTVRTVYGSKAGRFFARLRLSGYRILLDLILAALVLWRWMRVRANSGCDRSGALRGMGRTVLIPSAVTLVLVLISAVRGFFVRDGIVGMYAFTKALRGPYWLISVCGIACGIGMMLLGKYLAVRAARPKAEPLPDIPAAPVSRSLDSAVQSTEPEADAASAVPCISCGKPLRSGAKFCIYCGTGQRTGGNAVDEILEETAGKVSLKKNDTDSPEE